MTEPSNLFTARSFDEKLPMAELLRPVSGTEISPRLMADVPNATPTQFARAVRGRRAVTNRSKPKKGKPNG